MLFVSPMARRFRVSSPRPNLGTRSPRSLQVSCGSMRVRPSQPTRPTSSEVQRIIAARKIATSCVVHCLRWTTMICPAPLMLRTCRLRWTCLVTPLSATRRSVTGQTGPKVALGSGLSCHCPKRSLSRLTLPLFAPSPTNWASSAHQRVTPSLRSCSFIAR